MSRGLRMLAGWRSPLGRPGLAALGLLALALAAQLLASVWQGDAAHGEEALAALQSQLRASERAARQAAAQAAAPAGAPLPAADSLPGRVADLMELALRHGLSVQRSAQSVEPGPGGGASRMRLELSAEAGYLDLRRFLGEALRADPALALDSLRLRRSSHDERELQVELRWSLLAAAAVVSREGR